MIVSQADPQVVYVAHHMLLLAIPAFLPAVVVAAVILYVALKDRRRGVGPDTKQQSDPANKNGD
jgi:hypothetical protein